MSGASNQNTGIKSAESPFKEDAATGKWVCTKCRKEFATRKAVRDHCRYAASCRTRTRFSCSCGYATNIPQEIRRHKENTKRCKEIPQNAEKQENLEKDKVKAVEPEKMPTPLKSHASQSFGGQEQSEPTRRQIERKRKDKSLKKTLALYQCSFCPYKTNQPKDFQRHQSKASACTRINRQYDLWQRLGKDTSGEIWKSSKAELQCPKCGYTSAKSDSLRKHLASRVACENFLCQRRLEGLS